MENNENMILEAEPAAEPAAPAPAQEKQYSSLRYAWGAFAAFFGFSTKTHRASKKRAKLVMDIATYVVLLFGAFIMVYPFWWMLAGSFAYTGGTLSGDTLSSLVWWPSIDTMNANVTGVGFFHNYIEVFTRGLQNQYDTNGNIVGVQTFHPNYNYGIAVLNNLFYSIVPVVVGVITSASAAFAFAKIEWIGRNKVFFFLLAAIMVPGPSIMTAQYAMYSEIGFIENDTAWLVMVIPGLFGSIMTAFFIRQFLFGMPTSIIEAAKIDGAGYFRIFTQFILPLAMPAIMAQGLLSFMGCWNNYVGSYIFISSDSIWINLPHAMYLMDQRSLYGGGGSTGDKAPVIAASVVCVLPVLILFGCFQKLIIGSLMLTGSKE